LNRFGWEWYYYPTAFFFSGACRWMIEVRLLLVSSCIFQLFIDHRFGHKWWWVPPNSTHVWNITKHFLVAACLHYRCSRSTKRYKNSINRDGIVLHFDWLKRWYKIQGLKTWQHLFFFKKISFNKNINKWGGEFIIIIIITLLTKHY